MREAAEHLLNAYSNFISIDGAAEQTTLTNESVDLIFCGQAFHWFDKEKKCKNEFRRILKNGGHIVLAWNERSTKTEFQKEYESVLLENIDEYKLVSHRNIDNSAIQDFFQPEQMHLTVLQNHQHLDLQGLKGRLLSSSYCPKSGASYDTLMKAMELLFKKYEQEGKIIFEYETKIYWC